MSDLVSILMPVKNAGLYLDECIQSIVEQDYENWELLAVNDHSTDSSKEILDQWVQKDSRIESLENSGNGIIEALRTAFDKSSGEFIHRMDADDIMAKDKLSELLQLLKENGKGTVGTALVHYFADGGVSEGYEKYEKWINALSINGNHWDEIYQECVIASPCWLIYRSDLLKCEAFEPNRYPEDYDLVFRFYEQKMKVKAVQKKLHLWRDHTERSSRNDPHYRDSSFFQLKLDYFLKLERDESRNLIVWGAGPKGKRMAKMLQKKGVAFEWVSNNPNKHGKEIYDQLMKSFRSILEHKRPQLIITVAQRNAKKEIVSFLNSNGLVEKEDFYFFR